MGDYMAKPNIEFDRKSRAITRRKIILLLSSISITLMGFILTAPSVAAATYDFEVDNMTTNIYIQDDGSIWINYEIDFTNGYWGHEIDWVDIGMPNDKYELDTINASIDGTSISSYNIDPSRVIDIGVEVYLGSNAIPLGGSGHFSLNATNPGMVYGDYENKSMASVEFSPTWFDSDFCSQYDYLEMNIWFPETVNISKEGITKWHHPEHGDPTVKWEDNLMYFQWTKTNADMKQYTFGVSFPADAITYVLPWTANPALVDRVIQVLLTISGIGLAVGIIYLIWRYYAKTRKQYYPPKKQKKAPMADLCSVLVCFGFFGGFILLSTWSIFGDIYVLVGFFAIVIAGFGMIGYLLYRLIRRIGRPYKKPELMVELVGVKKGLTVVEAAVIKNIAIKKVIFLIIYGLLRSGHIEIKEIEPLRFEVLSDDDLGSLKWYHSRFIKTIKKSGPSAGKISESKLKRLLIDLIKRTHKRMKGYNLEATIAYYDNMIRKAWDKMEKLPDEKIDWEDMEDEFGWLMVDDLFEQKSERYFKNRYYRTYPYWYRRYPYYNHYWRRGYYYRYYPRYRGTPRNTIKTLPRQNINIFSFSDSIVRGMENMSDKLVSNFSSFAEGIVNKVRPIIRPKSTSRGGGRSYSGGGGCACACACACAGCACACAGGGR